MLAPSIMGKIHLILLFFLIGIPIILPNLFHCITVTKNGGDAICLSTSVHPKEVRVSMLLFYYVTYTKLSMFVYGHVSTVNFCSSLFPIGTWRGWNTSPDLSGSSVSGGSVKVRTNVLKLNMNVKRVNVRLCHLLSHH